MLTLLADHFIPLHVSVWQKTLKEIQHITTCFQEELSLKVKNND
jgi:hypothetical protein